MAFVCRGEFLTNFEGMGGLKVTDIKRERIPLLWRTEREKALAKGFSFNMGDVKYPCVCRKTTNFRFSDGTKPW